MRRGDLTDQQWQRLEPLLPPEKPWTGRPNEDHRQILNGIGTGAKLGVRDQKGIFSGLLSSWGKDTVAWIVRLVSTGADGEEHSTDVLRFARPEDLTDL